MSQELMSSCLALFIPCPNQREQIGDNRDMWVPSPSAVRPLDLAMFAFLGQIMGLCARSKELLSLNLPSIVWKHLVGQEILEQDVLSIDKLGLGAIEAIRSMDRVPNMSSQAFDAAFDAHFVGNGSDQQIRPLKPGGERLRVTWSNRHEFAQLLLDYRLGEFRQQCEAVRRGLCTVLPDAMLALMTWRELETMVCGRAVMDISLLKKMTVYDGCAASDLHIAFFWTVVSQRFSEAERAKLLRFVWGRSRLPLKPRDFGRRFKISLLRKSPPDEYFPVAHTCFFALDLPKYSSLDVTYARLLYAITHCEVLPRLAQPS